MSISNDRIAANATHRTRHRSRRNVRSVAQTSRRRVMRRRFLNNTVTANDRQFRNRGLVINGGLTRPPRTSAPFPQAHSPLNEGTIENTSEPNPPTNSATVPPILMPLNIIIEQICTHIEDIIPHIRSIDTTTANLLLILKNFIIDFMKIVQDITNLNGNGNGN
ncbi:unnamed protein product [Hymenolepis diminuta]|nr:unnamed protein product [Hymenolepis diminuta]